MKPAAALGSPGGGSHPNLWRSVVGRWYETSNGWAYDRDSDPDGQQPATTALPQPVPVDEPECERIRPRSDLDATGENIR